MLGTQLLFPGIINHFLKELDNPVIDSHMQDGFFGVHQRMEIPGKITAVESDPVLIPSRFPVGLITVPLPRKKEEDITLPDFLGSRKTVRLQGAFSPLDVNQGTYIQDPPCFRIKMKRGRVPFGRIDRIGLDRMESHPLDVHFKLKISIIDRKIIDDRPGTIFRKEGLRDHGNASVVYCEVFCCIGICPNKGRLSYQFLPKFNIRISFHGIQKWLSEITLLITVNSWQL
jgi:hypothetical protein